MFEYPGDEQYALSLKISDTRKCVPDVNRSTTMPTGEVTFKEVL